MRYDLTVTTTEDDELVRHIGWTVRDPSGEVVAVGTWMGSKLEIYTLKGAVWEALQEALKVDHQLRLIPEDF